MLESDARESGRRRGACHGPAKFWGIYERHVWSLAIAEEWRGGKSARSKTKGS